jgi:hypothetical protein
MVFRSLSTTNALDYKKLSMSIAAIKNLNVKTVYPGHGEPFGMHSELFPAY